MGFQAAFANFASFKIRGDQDGLGEQFLIGFCRDRFVEFRCEGCGRTGQCGLGKGEKGGDKKALFHSLNVAQGEMAFYSFVVLRRIGQ